MQSVDPRVFSILQQMLTGGGGQPMAPQPNTAAMAAKKKVPPKVVTPAFANRMPTTGLDAARQIAMNSGKPLMPGGQVGAVRMGAMGSGMPPKMGFDPFTYGTRPNYGEANFFAQNIRGGVSPISSVGFAGTPKNWDPGKVLNPPKGGPGKDPDKTPPDKEEPDKKPPKGGKPGGGYGSKFNPQ